MRSFIQKNHRFLFYSSWVLLGLIQSQFTQMQDDESYYWVYSKYPAWGYFDHPPMIAMLIKCGYAILHSQLGLRLFPLLLSTLSIWLAEKILRPLRPFLFYAVVLSVGVFQVTCFMAVPDSPLIFFTVFFFWCYKKFTASPALINSFLLGLAAALLLYSKYHGALIILLTLLSNLSLLKRYHLYVAGLTAFVLFLPHLAWQYNHHWPTVEFQLLENHLRPNKLPFFVDYLGGQLLMAGPVAGFILLPACWKYRAKDKMERALGFSLFGVYAFFLMSSFFRHIEANWTAPVIFPLMMLSYLFLNERPKWVSALFKTLPFTLLLVIFFRVIMIFDILPVSIIKKRFHSWKSWPLEMREKTKGLPVVFNNSYQWASQYWFHTGQMAYSLNDYKSRKDNYDFWPIADSLLGRPVFLLDTSSSSLLDASVKTPLGKMGYRMDTAFCSFVKIKIVPSFKKIVVKKGQDITISYRVEIPDNDLLFINAHLLLKDSIRIGVFDKSGWLRDLPTSLSLRDVRAGMYTQFSINPGLAPGKYSLLFAIGRGGGRATHNSQIIVLIVK